MKTSLNRTNCLCSAGCECSFIVCQIIIMMRFDNHFSWVIGWPDRCTQCSTQALDLTTFDKESSLLIKHHRSHCSQQCLTQALRQHSLQHWDPLFDLFCISRSSICISSVKWIWVTQQLSSITLEESSVTACISVSLQDEIIWVSSQMTIGFWTFLYYLSHIVLQLHKRISTCHPTGSSVLLFIFASLCIAQYRVWIKLS